MGSDQLFNNRQERNSASLQRRDATKSSCDRVLIICEGAKTEPLYFKEIKDFCRLNTANIDIYGKECGSDPLSVVNYAITKFKEEEKNNRDYDRVYCIIDRDKHTTFNDAMNKLRDTTLGEDVIFKAIISVPCFEFWLLLHFTYTTKPFCAQGDASNCDLVVKELKKTNRIPGYSKGDQNIFSLTKEKLPEAIKHAKQLQKHNHDSDSQHPATNMHELIEYLKTMNIR
jgi:hypothetical protein